MKKILVFLMVLLPMTAKADAVEIDGIWYNLVNKAKTAEVTRNPNVSQYDECYFGDIMIPSKVTYENVEYNVTTIGSNAFSCNYGLKSVSMQNGIISIGDWAFSGCSSLESVIISNSVTSIGVDAFSGCSSLESIRIPDGVTKISMDLFYLCTNLSSVNIPNGVTYIGSSAFQGCTKLTSITIPNTVLTIESCCFMSSGLKSVIIPNSVTTIWGNAFSECSNLTTVTIGSGIQKFWGQSFVNCGELTDFYCFSNDVPTIESNAFENSYVNLATLHVPTASISSYSASAPWSDFGTITAISSEDITIGDLGIGTFCGSNPIDFSSTDDLKAYVVSSFESATGEVILSRVNYVPPFTGVVVKGNKGVHTIPAGAGTPLYPNILKGVTENKVLNKVDGDYTNYILAEKSGNVGFYAVSNGSTLNAGKAYLPLPTAELPSSAREFILTFDDGETTNIKDVVSLKETHTAYYDLQGRRVAQPKSGLYIVNGKKVIIK